ncbi:MAG: pyridoxamine 5-phosphate oxidase [Ilumatobacteraceae bacterium]
MVSWREFARAEPEFAARVRASFDAGRHKTIATLRADGSPRISGIECEITDDDVRFGSMTGARKGDDLHRDARFALHGPTFHPAEGREADWPGEAKISGRAVPAGPVHTDTSADTPGGEFFVGDIVEVVMTGLDDTASVLVVESWTPSLGYRRVERA